MLRVAAPVIVGARMSMLVLALAIVLAATIAIVLVMVIARAPLVFVSRWMLVVVMLYNYGTWLCYQTLWFVCTYIMLLCIGILLLLPVALSYTNTTI